MTFDEMITLFYKLMLIILIGCLIPQIMILKFDKIIVFLIE